MNIVKEGKLLKEIIKENEWVRYFKNIIVESALNSPLLFHTATFNKEDPLKRVSSIETLPLPAFRFKSTINQFSHGILENTDVITGFVCSNPGEIPNTNDPSLPGISKISYFGLFWYVDNPQYYISILCYINTKTEEILEHVFWRIKSHKVLYLTPDLEIGLKNTASNIAGAIVFLIQDYLNPDNLLVHVTPKEQNPQKTKHLPTDSYFSILKKTPPIRSINTESNYAASKEDIQFSSATEWTDSKRFYRLVDKQILFPGTH